MLSHTSGVSGWESNQPLTFGNISGLDAAADKLAAKAPWWEPGTALGYHSWTLGHLLAAVVRRATGSTLQEFAVEEIVKPLGAESQLRVSESICPVLPTSSPRPCLHSAKEWIRSSATYYLPKGRVCFWGGLGGSPAVMDLDRKLTITYVMNRMTMTGLGNNAVRTYVKEIDEVLGVSW